MFRPFPSNSTHFVNLPEPAKNKPLSEQTLGSDPDKNVVSMDTENDRFDLLTSSTYPRSNSQFSTLNDERKNYTLKYVYQKKRQQKQYSFASTGQESISKESCVPLLLEAANPIETISEKDFCISFLKNHDLLGNVPIRTSSVGYSTIKTCSCRPCKTCTCNEDTPNLIICDDCDNAFHAWCCRPRINDIPTEEWFCNSCTKKKLNFLKEMKLRKLQNIPEGEAVNNPVDVSNVELTCLDMMLLDTNPHKTEVRIGKGFQAFVPEWSGPKPSDSYFVGEALEIDILDSERVHNPRLHNPARAVHISNWLQCKEVIRGIGKDIDGTKCLKWRRAPLCEVQRDEWDCFSAVQWDPAHADCAAPQELETEEVMKQLKYIQMLKPATAGKRQIMPQRKTLQGPSKCARHP